MVGSRARERSSLYLLADVLVRDRLGLSLHQWMLAGRTRVNRLSWPAMSGELARLTEDKVTATTVTLRSWFVADLELEAEPCEACGSEAHRGTEHAAMVESAGVVATDEVVGRS
jgi:hypothetical protein